MKKFSKLFLVILTVISIVCFIFYKSQYDKLYNVLQVLEFFGNQGGEEIGNKFASAFSNSLGESFHPAWLMVSSNIFVYSAYCKGNIYDTFNSNADSISCPEVNVIALVNENSKNINEQIQIICKLWYDDVREDKNGIASLSPFGEPSKPNENVKSFRPHIINCQNQFPSLIPYGISLQEDSFKNTANHKSSKNEVNANNAFIHIQPFVSSTQRLHLKNKSVNITQDTHIKRHPGVIACLGPSSNPGASLSSPQSLTEQVLVQNYFGVNNFLVYDSKTISPQFISAISERQSELAKNIPPVITNAAFHDSKLWLKIVPWNVPILDGKSIISGKNEFEVAQMDCYYRTISKYSSDSFESSIYLEPAQILVPKTTKENVHLKYVPHLLHHMAASELSEGSKVSRKYSLGVKAFCAEYPSEEIDSSITTHAINALRKLTYNSKISDSFPKKILSYHANNVEQSDQVKNVGDNLAIIHDYSSCGDIVEDDDAFEEVDNTLVEFGHDIDEQIGKYFPSVVMTAKQKQKLFRHKKKKRL